MTLTPSTHIAGITVVAADATVPSTAGNYLVIPLSSIPKLKADGSEVTDGEGDIRKVAFALVEMLYQVYAAEAHTTRPEKWSSYRSAGTEEDDGTATRSYTNSFGVNVLAVEVADEPVADEPE